MLCPQRLFVGGSLWLSEKERPTFINIRLILFLNIICMVLRKRKTNFYKYQAVIVSKYNMYGSEKKKGQLL